ncbi:Uridine-cytidine kinase-like 1 [Clonorchis sinensis]|uniref:Uridine kinase n=1 Tax=Clonorchis sinensis TaxID=79923 RepID=A0A419PRQ7_CLOSI|nr:Uridine-cytidine kinase-like 1 [Clonorchis sinensis]
MTFTHDSDSDNSDNPMRTSRRRKLISLSSTTWGLPEPVMRVGDRTIYTHGRPPWYDTEGQAQEPLVIGICGGSASGKTTVAREIIQSLDVQWVSLLSMDSYYRVLTAQERQLVAECNYNFDHPNSFDFDLLCQHLQRLRSGKSIEVPEYDFKTHSRTAKTKTVYGANVIILEGILVFCSPAVSELLDLKIFVDTDADERLARRFKRDISERGRSLQNVVDQYFRFVKPSYEQFIAPMMAQADIIIPRGGQNKVALQLIIQHVNKRLKVQGLTSRHALANFYSSGYSSGNSSQVNCLGPWGDCSADAEDADKNGLTVPNGKSNGHKNGKELVLPPQVHVLPSVPQTRGLHTIVRDCNTDQDEFVFYSERLMRPLCEYAMNLLPHMDVTVETPQGVPYHGRQLVTGTQVCGVSILRAGEALEPALCAVCKDVRLGKILIQTNPDTFEPELHYLRLPSDIKDCFVILMDSTVSTGAAAIMAMRVLVEHDVPEEKIIFISLIMALQGVRNIAYTYPKAHIVTTAVDSGLNDQYHILPGVGNFGDRYFGTSDDYKKCNVSP